MVESTISKLCDIFLILFKNFEGSWVESSKLARDTPLTPKKLYLLAYYWAVASFSGAGFGDITAQDYNDMILSICVMIHGTIFFGYVFYILNIC